jgi:DNA-binding GntR family transcriptional regulator
MSDARIPRIKRPQSLTTLVVDQIRDLIITEHFALGELLSESAIASLLGVSRAPVRDAFVRLQMEGLVDVQPQRGTFVFRYDATELREICELRQVLETGALRIGMQCNRESLIAALRQQVEVVGRDTALKPEAYQVHDTAFHDAVVRASCNRELIDAYNRIAGRIRAIRHRLTKLAAHVRESQREHIAILHALEVGRDADTEAKLLQHLCANYRRLLAMAGNSFETSLRR